MSGANRCESIGRPVPADPGCQTCVHNQKKTTACLLIGDIGGTNARFALANPDQPGYTQEKSFRCRDFQTAELALTRYLELLGAPTPDAICLAAAGPVVDGRVRFTNNQWRLDTRDLAAAFQIDRVGILNDFAAIAYALPLLQGDDCLDIGLLPGRPLAGRDFTAGVLGPGTGLGAAGLVGRAGSVVPIVGEAGHVVVLLNAQNIVQDEKLVFHRCGIRRPGSVSVEGSCAQSQQTA